MLRVKSVGKSISRYILLISAFFMHDSLNAMTPDSCLNKQYDLPYGPYLGKLEEQCQNYFKQNSEVTFDTITHKARTECIKSLASYDWRRDILTLSNVTTLWIRDGIRHHFPVVLKDACKWVDAGFSIVTRDDQMSVPSSESEATPVYNGFLLKPDPASYSSRLSEFYYMTKKHWRLNQVIKTTTDIHRDCSGITWHTFDEGVSANCYHNQQFHQVTLSNALSCAVAGLELVFVKDELYCLNIWDSMGVAMGKAIKNEFQKENTKHLPYFRSLFFDSGLNKPQLLAVMKSINAYMKSIGREHYIADIEAKDRVGEIMGYYILTDPLRFISPMTFVHLVTGSGIYGEIYEAGGQTNINTKITATSLFSASILSLAILHHNLSTPERCQLIKHYSMAIGKVSFAPYQQIYTNQMIATKKISNSCLIFNIQANLERQKLEQQKRDYYAI